MADALVITGPTASGKTRLSVDVAQRLDGEIVSMDSRQVYRGMDIGTAKPTDGQRAGVPHHGLDILTPDQRYSAGRFARDARRWIREISARGRVPVLVGGTGFFLRALTHPLFHEPRLDDARREALKQFLETFSREELLRWLHCLDETSATRLVHGGGRQRLARAIEIALLSGRTLSAWHDEQTPEDPLDLMVIALELPRDVLYARINQRVDEMLAAGLVDEVRTLVGNGYDEAAPAMNATGYIELLPYLRGQTTLAEAAERIRTNTRQYARRQVTWFRHQLPERSLRLDAMQPRSQLVERVVNAWQTFEAA